MDKSQDADPATQIEGSKIIIDKNYVTKNLGELAKDTDLSKFIL